MFYRRAFYFNGYVVLVACAAEVVQHGYGLELFELAILVNIASEATRIGRLRAGELKEVIIILIPRPYYPDCTPAVGEAYIEYRTEIIINLIAKKSCFR